MAHETPCACGAAEQAYSLIDAARLKGVHPDTLRRAIHATDATYLRAKRLGRKYLITAGDLDDWFDRLHDA